MAELDLLLEDTLAGGSDVFSELSKREVEILRMVVCGKTNKQIAGELSRSQRTVEYHRNRLMRKLGTGNTAELVRKAVSLGIS